MMSKGELMARNFWVMDSSSFSSFHPLFSILLYHMSSATLLVIYLGSEYGNSILWNGTDAETVKGKAQQMAVETIVEDIVHVKKFGLKKSNIFEQL